MDPYISAALVIFIMFAVGIGLVYRIYTHRTHTPSIDTDKILDNLIPKPPE